MTYQELTIFGRLRKLNKLGPLGMFQRLVHDWSADRERGPDDDAPAYTPAQVAEKVKRFFHYYAINRMCFFFTLARLFQMVTFSEEEASAFVCVLTYKKGIR
jgi:hypothetical protein